MPTSNRLTSVVVRFSLSSNCGFCHLLSKSLFLGFSLVLFCCFTVFISFILFPDHFTLASILSSRRRFDSDTLFEFLKSIYFFFNERNFISSVCSLSIQVVIHASNLQS